MSLHVAQDQVADEVLKWITLSNAFFIPKYPVVPQSIPTAYVPQGEYF